MNIQLFEDNSSKLKNLFSRISSKDGHLGLANFQVFCKNLNIIPSLLSPVDLKRHVDKIIKTPSNRATLKYSQFEGLLKEICFSSFQSSIPSDRISLFFSHINEPCMTSYKTSFTTSSRRKHYSNDFSSKREEENSSLGIDNKIKEALETLKSKDESFRSSRSTLSREVSPAPSIKSRSGMRSSDQVSISSSNLPKRPFVNMSMPDSPNTSVLGARPSSRYHNQTGKESELDEFLKAEKLVENEFVNGKNYAPRQPQKNIARNTISIKKIEYSKSKPDLMTYKARSEVKVTPRIEKPSPGRNLKQISVNLMKPQNKVEILVKRCKRFIKKRIPKIINPRMVVRMVFCVWKQVWFISKHLNNH